MALVSLEGGMQSTIIKHIVGLNFTYLISIAGGDITTSDIAEVAGEGITEFRVSCNANFAAINAAVGVSGLQTLNQGDWWFEVREKLNTNFGLCETELLAARTPSTSPSEATPSSSPSTSPSEATPSGSPSSSPSDATPSFGTGTASTSPSGSPSTSPSEATPSGSPSEATPSVTPSTSPSEATPSDSPSTSPSEATPSDSVSSTPSSSPSSTPSSSPE